MPSPRKSIPQAAAIALWKGRVCLVTSRSGKRWVVPKGCREPGMSLVEIVAMEAWEEAGLRGKVRKRPVGMYRYRKAGRRHRVMVYVMSVKQIADEWPEQARRERRFVRPEKAAARIHEDGLRRLLKAVA